MSKGNNGSMKIPGKKLKDGKYITEAIDFKTLSDDELPGFGQPVSLKAGQKMINDFQSELFAKLQLANEKEDKAAADAILEHPVAITLGKESLLYILTQKECEGIRFYFCHNHNNELSIVAVGAKNNPNSNPSSTLASKAKDLGSPEGKLSILNAESQENLAIESQFYFEVGPPTRLKDVDRKQIEGNTFEEEMRVIFSNR